MWSSLTSCGHFDWWFWWQDELQRTWALKCIIFRLKDWQYSPLPVCFPSKRQSQTREASPGLLLLARRVVQWTKKREADTRPAHHRWDCRCKKLKKLRFWLNIYSIKTSLYMQMCLVFAIQSVWAAALVAGQCLWGGHWALSLTVLCHYSIEDFKFKFFFLTKGQSTFNISMWK